MNAPAHQLKIHYKTFVSIGNGKQNFLRLLDAVHAHIDFLPKPVLIQSGYTSYQSNACDIVEFVNMDEFVNYIEDAEILITHAGAGSVMHAVRSGKYPIIMPRRAEYDECVNDHQVNFAKLLHEADKAYMVEHASDFPEALSKVKEIIAKHRETDNISAALLILQDQIKQLLHNMTNLSQP